MKKTSIFIVLLLFLCQNLCSCGVSDRTQSECPLPHGNLEVYLTATQIAGGTDEYGFWSYANVTMHTDASVAKEAHLGIFEETEHAYYQYSKTDIGNLYQTDVYYSDNSIYEVKHETGEIIGYRSRNMKSLENRGNSSQTDSEISATDWSYDPSNPQQNKIYGFIRSYIIPEEYQLSVESFDTFYSIRYEKNLFGIQTPEAFTLSVSKDSLEIVYFSANMLGTFEENDSIEYIIEDYLSKETNAIEEKLNELFSQKANYEILQRRFCFTYDNKDCMIYDINVETESSSEIIYIMLKQKIKSSNSIAQ